MKVFVGLFKIPVVEQATFHGKRYQSSLLNKNKFLKILEMQTFDKRRGYPDETIDKESRLLKKATVFTSTCKAGNVEIIKLVKSTS